MAGLLACLSVLAQSTSPRRPAPPAVGTAQISGTIRNAADDKPLPRARVIATADVLEEPRATITNSDGSFTFTDLPAGSYIVSATRTGFAEQAYGQARSITGTPIVVGTAQRIGNVDIALKPGGVIVGLILDEDGSPFAGAIVEALVTRFESGAKTLYSVATAQTDDRGEFRLFGLGPGEYYVSAQDPAFRAVSSPKGVVRYSPTYYPGTSLADQAKTVTVRATGTPPRVEFRIALVPPARVSGQLVAFDGKPLLSGAVVMSPIGGEGLRGVSPEDASIQPDGHFTFDNVVPGRYQIRARGQTGSGASLFAVFPADVISADVRGIELTLRPGALVEGHVIVEKNRTSKPPVLSALRVRAPFTDGAFGGELIGIVQSDGSFAIRGVMGGTHQFVIDGLPHPWVLKSVMLHGADVTDLEMPVTASEQIHDLRLTVTDASSEVSGVVQNARNVPAANVAVIVFSKVPLFWLRTSRRMRLTYTDVDGRFSVPGLPAGEYFAVASDAVDETDLGHRERLQALQAYAVPFRLATDDGRATVTLHVAPIVPAPAAR